MGRTYYQVMPDSSRPVASPPLFTDNYGARIVAAPRSGARQSSVHDVKDPIRDGIAEIVTNGMIRRPICFSIAARGAPQRRAARSAREGYEPHPSK
jgi:hypothetical protein